MHPAKSLLDDHKSAPDTGARLHEALHTLERVEREQRFLAEAGEALASSLDYHETLDMVAHLAAGSIASFCVVEVLGEDGRFLPIASEDVEETHCRHLCATVDSARPQDAPEPVLTALESNQVVVIPDLAANDPDPFFRALQAMGAVSLIVAPMRVRDRALGVILLASRVTERRYREDDARMASELARRAAMAVDNARLYQQAQRALRARDEMLSVVAHDLRNPLGIVGMSADLISDGPDPLPAAVRTGLERIKRSVDQMNRLIQDLLDVSKMEAGKLILDRIPISPADLLKEADYMLRPLAERAALKLELKLDPALPRILADRVRMLQAIGNLVANSIKFTAAGGSITLSAEPVKTGVRLAVSDEGKGIAAEHIPHLFDRFWQERPADSRGLGLGLAIVQGIVHAHGSKIEVESQLGRGTSMSFVLTAA